MLEDEFHFVLECSIYKDIRKTYIKRYYWQRQNMPKFIDSPYINHSAVYILLLVL